MPCSDGHYWRASNPEDIGRLAQGYKPIKRTNNTIYFIRKSQDPRYIKPQNIFASSVPITLRRKNPYGVRWMVGGNLIDYPHDASTKTADIIITVKTTVDVVAYVFSAIVSGSGDVEFCNDGDRTSGCSIPFLDRSCNVVKWNHDSTLNGIMY
ncbi:hypothetical protein IV203_009591 [Nitzschia inconspicua]|uniref:Uncharacterized protein n=1 Tax=Nitzschia inconspicua TaxID=303405 RepID=A0A9K3PKM3_9STRA|nr:hypothetical protein IV203_009591 [Nitzschia inconspicua]